MCPNLGSSISKEIDSLILTCYKLFIHENVKFSMCDLYVWPNKWFNISIWLVTFDFYIPLGVYHVVCNVDLIGSNVLGQCNWHTLGMYHVVNVNMLVQTCFVNVTGMHWMCIMWYVLPDWLKLVGSVWLACIGCVSCHMIVAYFACVTFYVYFDIINHALQKFE